MGTNQYKSWVCTFGFLFLTILLAVDGFAVCETPETTGVRVFLPFLDEGRDGSSLMTTEMVDQGYTYAADTMRYVDNHSNDNDPELCTIENIETILESGDSLWMHTHGGCCDLSIEVYHDQIVRDTKYLYYLPTYGDCISAFNTSTGKYTIAVTDVGGAAWSLPKKQIYFLGACYSDGLFDDFPAGLELGYTYDVYPDEVEQDANVLFKNMSGRRNGGSRRDSGHALSEPDVYTDYFASAGSIRATMVLAPAVKDWFPREAARAECEGYVEFDCTMDTDSERTAGVVYGSGCVNVGNVQWESDHNVTFPLTQGTGWSVLLRVNAQKAVSANNHDIQLDGNMLPYPPYSTNGVAPNEDNFQWTVPCCYDIYVTVSGFGSVGGGPCGAPACANRNNGSFTLTWNGAGWQGYASPCGNYYLSYDSGSGRWKYTPQCMCGVLFYNDASNADWPPKTGWYPQSGHICGSGSMTLDYCGCD